MHFPGLKTFILSVVALFSWSANSSERGDLVEGPPLLFTSDLVEESLRVGERFQLAPIAHVVDFGYEFRLRSDFGDYDIRGMDMLETRIQEIEALEKLEEIGKTRAFATSFSEALKNPVVRSWAVAKRPISTMKGLPQGILRYIQGKFYEVKRSSEKVVAKARSIEFRDSKARSASEASAEEPAESKVVETAKRVGSKTKKLGRRHFGFDKAKREWARRLKVDPYTTNEYLQLELDRIAWAASMGSFVAEYAIPSSAVLSYTLQAQELVWSKSATELERINYQSLARMGVDSSALNVFDESDYYTLSEKTLLVLALKSLDVEGRLDLVQLLLEAQTRDEAVMMVKVLKVFGNYHRLVEPLNRIAIRRGMAVGYVADGKMILPLVMDYLHWTPEITEVIMAEELKSNNRSLLIGGVASSIAKRQLAMQDWQLQENCFETFKLMEELP